MLTVARTETTEISDTAADLRIRSLFDDPTLRRALGMEVPPPAAIHRRIERPPVNIRQLLERAAA